MSELTEQSIITAAGTPVVSYARAAELTGGILARKSLYNICSRGEGPPRIKVGQKVGFVTEEFARWFCNRVTAA